MNTQEWALIIFTTLTQMSVGAFIVLGVVHFFVERKAGLQEADRMSDRVLIAILVTLGLGMVASLFHLGNPLNAYKAVTNLGTSWLSREILAGVIFAILALLFVLMQWRKIGSAQLRRIIAVITAVVGLFLIYCQARIYMLPAQPAWNSVITPISFFVSTFLLGVLAIGAALVANCAIVQRKSPECATTQYEMLRQAIRWLSIASIILVGIEIIITPLYLASLGNGSSAAQRSLAMIAGELNIALILRMLLGFVGAVVVAAFLYNYVTSEEKKNIGVLAFTAFAFVFVAEILARYIFYASHINIGL